MSFDRDKVEAAIRVLIDGLGHPKNDPNILDTPQRVAAMFQDILDGHDINPGQYIKCFPSDNKEMVIVRNVPFYSYCAHHLQPFYGKLTIAYLPGGSVIGLSKLIRIARTFAKRLQLQENLTHEIAEFLHSAIPHCQGAAVSLRAEHMCMIVRGVKSYGAETVTEKYCGDFNLRPELREQFRIHLSDQRGY